MPGLDRNAADADGAPVIAETPRAALAELWLALGVTGAIWLLAASRWLVTDTVVPWDSKNQFYAFFRFLAATLHSGASPFWNP